MTFVLAVKFYARFFVVRPIENCDEVVGVEIVDDFIKGADEAIEGTRRLAFSVCHRADGKIRAEKKVEGVEDVKFLHLWLVKIEEFVVEF